MPRYTLVEVIAANLVLAHDAITGVCRRIHPDLLDTRLHLRAG